MAPALGRFFADGEDQAAAAKTAVISYGLWQRLFAGAPSVLAQSILLDGTAYAIIGVTPASYTDVFNPRSQVWTPLVFAPEQFGDNRRTDEYLAFAARLAPGVSLDVAQRDLSSYAEQLMKDFPHAYGRDWTLRIKPLHEEVTGHARAGLLILLGAVGFVLLIACANVANLLLTRGASRLRDIAQKEIQSGRVDYPSRMRRDRRPREHRPAAGATAPPRWRAS